MKKRKIKTSEPEGSLFQLDSIPLPDIPGLDCNDKGSSLADFRQILTLSARLTRNTLIDLANGKIPDYTNLQYLQLLTKLTNENIKSYQSLENINSDVSKDTPFITNISFHSLTNN